MRILILNWRDIRSPRAGGAEMLTHEVAWRLADRGHEITWFTSRPAGLPGQEELDGIRVVRRGSEGTTRMYAPMIGRKEAWDVVVEEINTLPYFAPLWSKAPVVVFIPQLARGVWWYEAPKLIAPLGYVAEPWYLRSYRDLTAVTISASTRDDLRALGLRGRIHILPMAVSTPALSRLPRKTPVGRLISIGRLVSSKRMDHAIRTVALLETVAESTSLTIVGQGPQREPLERLAKRLRVQERIEFVGGVPDDRKYELIREADFLVACSVREGWGLTVTEAARLGTPAVAYDVAGLRDSIIAERTGLLTPVSPSALAGAIRRALDEAALYSKLREAAWRESLGTDWDHTAASFERALLSARGSFRGEADDRVPPL